MLKKEKKRAADALAGRPVTPRQQHGAVTSHKRSASTNEVTTGSRRDVGRGRVNGGVMSPPTQQRYVNGGSGSGGGVDDVMRRNSSSQSLTNEEPLRKQVCKFDNICYD